MAKTDIWVLGTERPDLRRGGRKRGGIIGVHAHRPNGWYGEDMKPPTFLRVTVTDRSPEELARYNQFHLNDPAQRGSIRHPFVLAIDRLPAVLHEQLVGGGHASAPWSTWQRYFEKRVTLDI